jgi:hypothetical protein
MRILQSSAMPCSLLFLTRKEIRSAVRAARRLSKIGSLFCRALQGKLVKKGTTQSIAGSIITKSLGCPA